MFGGRSWAVGMVLVLAFAGCRRAEVTAEPAPANSSTSVTSRPTEAPAAMTLIPPSVPPVASASEAKPPKTRHVDGGPSDAPFDAEEAERIGWPKGWIPSRIRETTTVVIGGVKERWSLVWTTLPEPYCFGLARTCPCKELGHAEAGELELWRERPGQKTEVRVLTGFGHEAEMSPQIAVPRFPVGTPLETEALKRARSVSVLTVHDYNHDGLAAEFPLTGMYLNQCNGNDRETWLIGVTRKNDALHAIGTADNPDSPLTFGSRRDWEAVRAATKRIEIVIFECWPVRGGSEVYDLTIAPDGLHGVYRTFDCSDHPHARRIRQRSVEPI